MNNFTFILASHNNGYDNTPEDPVENYHLQRTVFFVERLKRIGLNVVFVDWCSDRDNQYKNFLPKGVKYIYVIPEILNELHNNNDCSMSFYEWISKDIASFYSDTDNLIFTNGDNLFSKKFFNEIGNIDTSKAWYSGNRINIGNLIFKDKLELENTLNNNPKNFEIFDECGFCYGDLTIISKENYNLAGGYNYSHVHAYEDTRLAERLKNVGIAQNYISSPFYHLYHSKTSRSKIFSNSIIDKNYIKGKIIDTAEVDFL
jgi:hypothetical protein